MANVAISDLPSASSVTAADVVVVNQASVTKQATLDLLVTMFTTSIAPPGVILDYAGSSAPTGWLECTGAAVSRSTYSALFSAISTTWGSGDGSTTFNLPNFVGRTRIGKGTGTTTETVTASSGNGFTVSANNTKWITGMAVVVSALSGFTTSASAGPTYYIYRASSTNVRLCSTLAIAQNATTGSMETVSGSGSATLTYTLTARTLAENGGEETHAESSTEQLSHTHTITSTESGALTTGTGGGSANSAQGSNGDAAVTIASTADATGGNVAMNNMQPFAVTMTIIKT